MESPGGGKRHLASDLDFDEPKRLKSDADSSLAAMPTRQYLDATVVPILLDGLAALARARPEQPVDFLGSILRNSHFGRKLFG
jgi:protein dpy-30